MQVHQPRISPFKLLLDLLRNYFYVIFGALVFAFFLRIYIIEAYRIPSDFMSPSLMAGDFILVNKVAYGGKFQINTPLPKPGDIVVFSFLNEPNKEYIKRVVAVAGDEIEIKDGQVLVNKKSITSLQANQTRETLNQKTYAVSWDGVPKEMQKMMAIKVPDKSYFVLSDNRAKGLDSRSWGFLPATTLKGRAFFIWFSKDENAVIRWSRFFTKVQ